MSDEARPARAADHDAEPAPRRPPRNVAAEVLGWTSLTELADAVSAALLQVERELALEQAVHGLDTMSEVALQTLLWEQLGQSFAVAREVHYPSSAGAKRSHRQRCDLVLSPKGMPLETPAEQQLALPLSAAGAPPRMCRLTEAFWLEVKVAYQFRPGGLHHKGYSAQFRQAVVADLRKLAAEPLIDHAALLLIVFNESAAVAGKDLDLFESLLIDKEALAGFRHVRSLPIQDRIGHHLCTVAVWPIIGSAPGRQKR